MQKPIAVEVQELRAEVESLMSAAKDSAAEVEAARAALAAAHESHGKDLADAGALVASLQAEVEALRAVIADANEIASAAHKRADEAERKLALVPAVADVTAGAQPVADGGAAVAMDWIKEVERRTGADRIAFYRANRAAIDAAYDGRR